jgi:hypothetical protein
MRAGSCNWVGGLRLRKRKQTQLPVLGAQAAVRSLATDPTPGYDLAMRSLWTALPALLLAAAIASACASTATEVPATDAGRDGASATGATDSGNAADATSKDAGAVADGSAVDAGPPITLAQGCAKWASAYCAYLQRCNQVGFKVGFLDMAQCEAAVSKGCVYRAAWPDSNSTGANYVACASAYNASASCATTPSCSLVTGRRRNGAPCDSNVSCASGYCAATATGQSCQVCSAFLELGEACDGTPLRYCNYTKGLACGANKKCEVPTPTTYAALGAPCGGQVFCGLNLYCAAGKCARSAPVGGACPMGVACEAESDCNQVTRKCEARTFVTPGMACPPDGPITYCRTGGCRGPRNTALCVANPREGETCDPTYQTTGACGSGYEGMTCNKTTKKCEYAPPIPACN